MILILFTVKKKIYHAFILQNCEAYHHAYKLDYSSLIHFSFIIIFILFFLLNLIN